MVVQKVTLCVCVCVCVCVSASTCVCVHGCAHMGVCVHKHTCIYVVRFRWWRLVRLLSAQGKYSTFTTVHALSSLQVVDVCCHRFLVGLSFAWSSASEEEGGRGGGGGWQGDVCVGFCKSFSHLLVHHFGWMGNSEWFLAVGTHEQVLLCTLKKM